MKTIRLFCVAGALTAMLAAASQAQEAASEREQSRAGTASSVLNDVSLTTDAAATDASQNQASQNQVQNQEPPRKDTTTDGQSSLPDAPKPAVSPSTPTNPDQDYGKQNKRILWVIPN